MSALWHDFRDSIRALRTNFSLTVAIIITVGLAIGANTAIFNLLDQTVLRPLPVEKPGELAIVNVPAWRAARLHPALLLRQEWLSSRRKQLKNEFSDSDAELLYMLRCLRF